MLCASSNIGVLLVLELHLGLVGFTRVSVRIRIMIRVRVGIPVSEFGMGPSCKVHEEPILVACIIYTAFSIHLIVMVALWNRADHYIFALWFLSFFLSFFSSLNLSGCILDVWRLAGNIGRKNDAKNRHMSTIALCRAISSQLRHISTIRKILVKQQYVLHICP